MTRLEFIFRHCERSAAIQSPAPHSLDCFASLAMTGQPNDIRN